MSKSPHDEDAKREAVREELMHYFVARETRFGPMLPPVNGNEAEALASRIIDRLESLSAPR